MSDTCPECERLREAIDKPLLDQGYLPTEEIEESPEGLTIRMKKDRRESSAAFVAKAIIISEVVGSFPGYDVTVLHGATSTSVIWALKASVAKKGR